jgi:leucyl aminopeptidase
MKALAAIALSATAFTGALAAVITQETFLNNPRIHHEQEKYLIELAPYRTRWVTEEEKWALKLVPYFPKPRIPIRW